MNSPTRFVKRCVTLAKVTVVGLPNPAVKKGKGGFADWFMISIFCLKDREEETYRSVIEWLAVADDVRRQLHLTRAQLPDYTTVQKAFDGLTMALFRRLLQQTTTLHELGDIAAIDASNFDRVAASRRYATRTDYRFRSLKTTILVDCLTGAILDVHCSTTKSNDTKIGWQVLKRNLDRLSTIITDKGYDWDDLREMLRKNGVRPVIKHREFDSLDRAHNARLDRRSLPPPIGRRNRLSRAQAALWRPISQSVLVSSVPRIHPQMCRQKY